ncbi:hypothetical protein [Marinicella meishanensis]|uniref:hypothetical protein n=1 Tax=Marinicella meishanensis TaxID=2873263 RepID=UPI001CBEC45B|nr:hypothetical protein [Marinicella sp. NBU2979]
MNPELEKQLKQDAQAIQAQAQQRLATLDLDVRLAASLTQSPRPNRSPQRVWLGLAAGFTLAVLVTVFAWQNQASVALVAPELVANKPINPPWQPNAQQLEQRIYQPLHQEQQAIIEDLKALKTHLLSI